MAVSSHLSAAGLSHLGAAVRLAAFDAFLHGLSVGCLVAGGVALLGSVIAIVFLPAQPPSAGTPGASEEFERARDLAVGASLPSREPVQSSRPPSVATVGPVSWPTPSHAPMPKPPTAEDEFEAIPRKLLRRRDVTVGSGRRGFGSGGLQVGGRVFARSHLSRRWS
jgi:hypothetical protein